MKRRDALKTMGALAGATAGTRLLAACGDNALPPGIDHIVVVMMENRSYDHLLGARAFEGLPGDGLTRAMSNPDLDGVEVPAYEATIGNMCVPDPPHGWAAAHNSFAAGANTGFVAAHQNSHGDRTLHHPMEYLTRAHVPVTWALADAYTSCDRTFCSVMGPTWPNRMYWHSGSSNAITSNDLPLGGFTWPSIHHRLDDKGVPWRYYYVTIPVLAIVDTLDKTGRLFLYEQFFRDAAKGDLAPVTYLDPGFNLNDDHPPIHPIYGQQFLASIYLALASSPVWDRTMLVITYDENGGFFDHVPPPTTVDDFAGQGFDQMGFRVPNLVIGPYIKQGVSSTVRDHCSTLAHIERRFDLVPLNQRTRAANDFSDVIDTDRIAAGAASAPIKLPALEIDESQLGADCAMIGTLLDDHPMHQLADRYPDRFAAYDNRKNFRDQLYLIGDFLEQHNAGRIRRGR
ncbi:MAG: phosphoesterase [Myxococcales bacterium]|nr:phosphoesterase [Myxococcales bacterium]